MSTAVVDSPIAASSPEPASTATANAVFVGRSIRRFLRRPDSVVFTVAFPLLLLLTMLAVFSSAVEAFEDADYAQRLVPGLTVSGVLFGSLGTAVGFWSDLDTGFMDRVRSLPVSPAAPLVGTVLAEAVRALMAVVALAAAGYAFGFRFEAGVGRAIGYFVAAMIGAMAFTWIGLYVATIATSQESLSPPLNAFFLVLLFFSEGLVPLDAYPGWAQPFVEANPATAFVTLLDRLARGGDLGRPILNAALWSIAIVAVFGTLAVRRLAVGRSAG
ncbi:MAG: ABC transporter permease [Actinomycetota bacterium]